MNGAREHGSSKEPTNVPGKCTATVLPRPVHSAQFTAPCSRHCRPCSELPLPSLVTFSPCLCDLPRIGALIPPGAGPTCCLGNRSENHSLAFLKRGQGRSRTSLWGAPTFPAGSRTGGNFWNACFWSCVQDAFFKLASSGIQVEIIFSFLPISIFKIHFRIRK